MSLLKVQVRNQYFDVEVNRDGMFHTELHDETFKAETLAELKDALGKALARAAVKISVPFIVYAEKRYRDEEREIRRGTITGQHAGNSNYLVKWDNGKTDQVRKWELEDLVPQALEQNFLPIVQALEIAQNSYNLFVKEHRINLEKEVDQKVEKSA